jgi:hypothetical protein
MLYDRMDMALTVLAVVELQRITSVPRDVVENTFAFSAITGTAIDTGAVATALENFYKLSSVHHTLEYYLSDNIAKTGTHHIKFYDLGPVIAGSGDAGPPIADVTFTMAGSTALAGDMPDEVAACISIHADITGVPEHSGATRPRARHRGRLFIGPLQGGTATTQVDSGFCHLKTAFMEDLAHAATTLIGLGLDGNAAWGVWSRKDGLVRPVVGGWVDNAWDTQRRRQVDATSRVTI